MSGINEKIIIFDFETNGFVGSSVLEGYFLRCKYHGKVLEIEDEFHRFYFPKEPFDRNAMRVHGLDREKIKSMRAESRYEYPEYFVEDEDFITFSSGIKNGWLIIYL